MKNVAFLFALLLPFESLNADTSRYPYDDFSNAGDTIGTFKGVHDAIFPLSLTVNVDATFSDEEKKIIKNASSIYLKNAMTKAVLDCAFDKAKKDGPKSREEFEAQLFQALMLRKNDDLLYPGFAYIARYWNDAKSVGLGYVNLFYDTDKPAPGYKDRHYFHIALNSDFMGEDSKYTYAKDEDYWAGVIGHEFLHNLGYRHPNGYPGSFVYEYGVCVTGKGAEKFELKDNIEDKEVAKDL